LDLGIQKKHLARKLGVDETTIHNWEDKGVTPTIRFIPSIIEFLGYDPNHNGDVVLSIAERLKSKRTKLGLSRRRLAALLGMDESSLAGWERREHRPTHTSLIKVERFLSDY